MLTDGDLRHAFARGLGLHTLVSEVMTREFRHGAVGMTKSSPSASVISSFMGDICVDGSGARSRRSSARWPK